MGSARFGMMFRETQISRGMEGTDGYFDDEANNVCVLQGLVCLGIGN